MILRKILSNRPYDYILFFLGGVFFWIISLRNPKAYDFYDGENANLLYAPIHKITVGIPVLQVLLSLILVFFIAFLIQQINNRYALINARTKLPVAVFIITAGGLTPLHTLHPVWLAAVFTLLAINSLFAIFNNPSAQPDIFNTGMFISIGTLFYFNLIFLLPAFLISISILRRETNIKEFMILVTGFVIPLLFAFSYAYVTDQMTEMLHTFQKNIISPVNHFKNNYPLQGFLGILVLLTVIGSVKILQQYDSRKVSNRKYFVVFFMIFIFSMSGFVFNPASSQEMLIIAIIPVTYLITNLFVSIKSRFWAELLFSVFLGAAIIMQFADKLNL